MLVVIYKCNRAFINTCNQYVAFFLAQMAPHTNKHKLSCIVLPKTCLMVMLYRECNRSFS